MKYSFEIYFPMPMKYKQNKIKRIRFINLIIGSLRKYLYTEMMEY